MTDYLKRVLLVRRVIARELYSYRVVHGMTIADMSELLGVSSSSLSYWERMKSTMEVETMLLVYQKIGVNLMNLILNDAE